MQLEAKFKAENNILKRANQRLFAEKADDAARVAALTAEARSLKDQVSDEQLTVVKLKREVEERDALIADNYNTLQGLRRRCQELEKHKFVLSYKVREQYRRTAGASGRFKSLDKGQLELWCVCLCSCGIEWVGCLPLAWSPWLSSQIVQMCSCLCAPGMPQPTSGAIDMP